MEMASRRLPMRRANSAAVAARGFPREGRAHLEGTGFALAWELDSEQHADQLLANGDEAIGRSLGRGDVQRRDHGVPWVSSSSSSVRILAWHTVVSI